MTENKYPLSIRDVAPHAGAVRLTGISPNGIPSGVHTGGAWLWDDMVYKPLDGRPFANAEWQYPTDEDKFLEFMAVSGNPLFPRNWNVEELNGRRFLVRKKAYLIPEDFEYRYLNRSQALSVESGIRQANSLGWEIGDDIALAFDADSGALFVYDCSTAIDRTGGQGCYQADEEWRINAFFKVAGYDNLYNLRKNARAVFHDLEGMQLRHDGFCYVYGSFNRPIDGMWASFPVPVKYVTPAARPSWDSQTPHTWVVSSQPIPDDTLRRYELEWGWSPIAP